MKPFKFDQEKDKLLKEKRGIGFLEIIKAIEKGGVLKVIDHPNKTKYPRQRIYLIKFSNYIYAIPFVEEEDYFFLKTIIPSRRYTKKYLKNNIINFNLDYET